MKQAAECYFLYKWSARQGLLVGNSIGAECAFCLWPAARCPAS